MPRVEIDIVGRFAQFQDALTQVGRSTERLAHSFESFKRIATGAFLGHEVKEFAASVLEAGLKFEQSQARVQGALRATGNAAGITSAQIEDFAKELSKKTRFDDSGVREAAAVLLRYRDVQGQVFKEALELAPDVAEALGTTLPEATQKWALALQDPQSGLKGIRGAMSKFSEAQADHIARLQESGKLYQAQRILIDQVKASVGGLAQEINQGLTKSTTDITKAWDDFKRSLATTPVVKDPVVNTLNYISQAFEDLDEDIERLKKAKGAAQTLQELAHSLAPSRARLRVGPEQDQVVEPTTAAERADIQKAQAAEQARRVEAARDQAYREEQRRIKDAAALTRARAQIEIEAQKQTGDQINQVLQDSYEQGLILTRDYFGARLSVEQNALAQEIAGIDRAVAAQQKLLSAPSTSVADKPGIRVEIERLQAERARKVQEQSFAPIKTEIELRKQNQQLLDARVEVDAKALEDQGKLADAAKLRLGIEQRTTRVLYEQAGISTEALDKAAARAISMQKFTEAQRDAGFSLDDLRNQEAAIANQVQRGQTDELSGLLQIDNARKAEVERLKQIADAQEKAAVTPEQIQAVKNLRQEIDNLAASAHGFEDKFKGIFTDSLTTPLEDFLEHTKSAKEAFADFAKSIERALVHLAAEGVAKQLGATLFSSGSSSGGASGLDFAALAAKLFVSSQTGAPVNIPTMAEGGLVTKATLALIGERGPELVLPVSRFAGGGIGGLSDGQSAFFGGLGTLIDPNTWWGKLLLGAGAGQAAGIGSGGGGGFDIFKALFGGLAFGLERGGIMPLRSYSVGGIATRPQLALFGEGRMPEAYVPLPDGRSIPVSMRGAVAAPHATVIHQTFAISTPDVASFKRSESQITTSMAMAAQRALARR